MPFYLSFIEVLNLDPDILIVNYFSIIQKSPSDLFQTPPEYVRFKFVAHFKRRAVDENKEFSQIVEDALNQYLGKPRTRGWTLVG